MEDHKKLDFIHKMAKLGLQHFDSGGGVGDFLKQNSTQSTALNLGVGGETQAFVPSGGNAGQQNPYVQANATNPNTGLFGTIAGGLGMTNNFQASSANVTPGTNAQQLQDSYTNAQNALANQQGIANTLTPQVGQAVNQQNALANQYAAMAAGRGPNPAQNQLAQATAANTANQAALMAGQRGASQNVGLLARQNAMQGAANQQQSAGQAATLGSQQQIAAQNNLANLSNAQINQAGQATTGLNTAAQGEQGILQGANSNFNNAITGMQSNINNVNAQTSAANTAATGKIGGGALNLVSSLFAEGGEVDQEATNLGKFSPSSFSDPVSNIPGIAQPSAPAGGDSGGKGGGLMGSIGSMFAHGGPIHRAHFNNHINTYFASGGKVPAMVSPGEIYLSPDKVHKVLNEGANPLKIGNRIKGKAKVKGDSYKNDTIPANLDEGGIVIDRKNAMNPDKAMLFVHQTIAKKRAGK